MQTATKPMYNGELVKKPNISRKNVSYDEAHEAADYILARTDFRPTLGLILGTGLSGIAELVEDKQEFSYKEIPNFKSSTAPGHKGNLILGYLRGSPVICMNGRLHLYEGYSAQKCTMPVYMMHLLGVQSIIVTNAAGGLNQEYVEGDFMILKDHINLPGLAGRNPLMGPNDDRFGPRFLALSDAYDKTMRQVAWKVAQDLGMLEHVHEGVYIQQTGPCYETVAESRMMRLLGADVVGMSTLPEVITARHCGMKVFAMSLVTNMAILEYDVEEVANEEEVLNMGRQRSSDMQKFMMRFVSELYTAFTK